MQKYNNIYLVTAKKQKKNRSSPPSSSISNQFEGFFVTFYHALAFFTNFVKNNY